MIMISTDQRTETEQKAAYLDIYIFGTIKTVSVDQQINITPAIVEKRKQRG